MKKSILLFLAFILTACSTSSSATPTPQVTVTSQVTVTLPLASLTPEPTESPAPTATPEAREFVPANNIELSGDLVQKYGLEFSPYADKEAIYKDILRSHFNDYINSNIPENAEIMKQMPEHLKDVTLNSDPELVDEFIQTFFELSGGKAVFTDLGWRRYTIDANLPIMFEVIKVDKLPSNYFGVMDANPNDKTHRGAGVSMYSFDNGQIVYSIAIVSDTLEYNTEVNEASPYYLAEWDIDQTISNQFRRYIASIYSHSITNGESQSSNYELYIKSTTPNNAHDFFRDIDWEFITAR